MGAPKLNKNAFKKSPARSKAGDSNAKISNTKINDANIKDKKAIKHYQEKINEFVQSEENAKKAAFAIEELMNNSNNTKKKP